MLWMNVAVPLTWFLGYETAFLAWLEAEVPEKENRKTIKRSLCQFELCGEADGKPELERPGILGARHL